MNADNPALKGFADFDTALTTATTSLHFIIRDSAANVFPACAE